MDALENIRPKTAACTINPRSGITTPRSRENKRPVQAIHISKSKQHETLAAKMSTLTLGTGKITQADKLELHLNNDDFSELITQRLRPSDRFSVIRSDNCGLANHPKLPKTFVTRSGSLFLYSDSKVVKDKAASTKQPSNLNKFCVNGTRLTQNPDTKKLWKKYLVKSPRQTGEVNKDVNTGQYSTRDSSKFNVNGLGRLGQAKYQKRIVAVKDDVTSNAESKETHNALSLDTVKELSDALLEYRLKQITDRERYENTVMNAWGGKPTHRDSIRDTNIGVLQRRISAWTLDWLQTPRRRSQVQDPSTDEQAAFEKHFLLLQRAKTDLSLASEGVVPTNTPFSNNDKKGLGSHRDDRPSSKTFATSGFPSPVTKTT